MAVTEDHVESEQEDWESVEGLAEDDEPVLPMQIPLEGLGSKITMTPGGVRATTASITLRGGKLPVEGQFEKGDVVELYVRCRIADIQFPDTHDKYGEVTGCERRHVAKMIAVRRFSPEE